MCWKSLIQTWYFCRTWASSRSRPSKSLWRVFSWPICATWVRSTLPNGGPSNPAPQRAFWAWRLSQKNSWERSFRYWKFFALTQLEGILTNSKGCKAKILFKKKFFTIAENLYEFTMFLHHFLLYNHDCRRFGCYDLTLIFCFRFLPNPSLRWTRVLPKFFTTPSRNLSSSTSVAHSSTSAVEQGQSVSVLATGRCS